MYANQTSPIKISLYISIMSRGYPRLNKFEQVNKQKMKTGKGSAAKGFFKIMAILLVVGMLPGLNQAALAGPPAASQQKDVIMFATSWCPYCAKARKFLRRNGIRYTEYDIEEPGRGRQLYNRIGARGVPVFLIEGKVVNGFHEPMLRAILLDE